MVFKKKFIALWVNFYTAKHDQVVFDLFHKLIKSLLLGMKRVFKDQNQHTKFTKCE